MSKEYDRHEDPSSRFAWHGGVTVAATGITAAAIVLSARQNTLLARLADELAREFEHKTKDEHYELLKQSLIKELFK